MKKDKQQAYQEYMQREITNVLNILERNNKKVLNMKKLEDLISERFSQNGFIGETESGIVGLCYDSEVI